MPVEGFDYLEDQVEELFNRGENLDISEFMVPTHLEVTIGSIIEEFNLLKAQYEFSDNPKDKKYCIIQGCMLISGLLLFEFED